MINRSHTTISTPSSTCTSRARSTSPSTRTSTGARRQGGRHQRRRVINTTSGAGLRGNVGQAAYAAAKAGIVGLTLVTALEMRRYGVTANAISPMAFTRMVATTMERPEQAEGAFDALDPSMPRAWSRTSPHRRRRGSPVRYCVSKDARCSGCRDGRSTPCTPAATAAACSPTSWSMRCRACTARCPAAWTSVGWRRPRVGHYLARGAQVTPRASPRSGGHKVATVRRDHFRAGRASATWARQHAGTRPARAACTWPKPSTTASTDTSTSIRSIIGTATDPDRVLEAAPRIDQHAHASQGQSVSESPSTTASTTSPAHGMPGTGAAAHPANPACPSTYSEAPEASGTSKWSKRTEQPADRISRSAPLPCAGASGSTPARHYVRTHAPHRRLRRGNLDTFDGRRSCAPATYDERHGLDGDFDVGDAAQARVPGVLRHRPHQRRAVNSSAASTTAASAAPPWSAPAGVRTRGSSAKRQRLAVVGCLEPEPVLRPHP